VKKAAKELTGIKNEGVPGKLATAAVRERSKVKDLNIRLGRRKMKKEWITRRQINE